MTVKDANTSSIFKFQKIARILCGKNFYVGLAKV